MISIGRRIAQLESASRNVTPAISDEDAEFIRAGMADMFQQVLADMEANPGPEIVGDDWIEKLNQIGREPGGRR